MIAADESDWPIRLAAFRALEVLTRSQGPILPWGSIERGFDLSGHHFLFANQSKGIFRPFGMTGAALSIKSTVPRTGQRKYEDIAHEGAFTYALQSRGVEFHDNKLLLAAERLRVPIIYFFGVEPGFYRPIWPAYVVDFDPAHHCVSVVAGAAGDPLEPGAHIADATATTIVRRYATVEVKKRLHQEVFRKVVLDAYEERCAVCQLPRRELLDAAHIDPDCDPRGEPKIDNGLALCKLHHGAYDADLIGIRPDLVIEISSVLRETNDGPTLEHALKGFAGSSIHVPRRRQDRPDIERLELRFERFKRSA